MVGDRYMAGGFSNREAGAFSGAKMPDLAATTLRDTCSPNDGPSHSLVPVFREEHGGELDGAEGDRGRCRVPGNGGWGAGFLGDGLMAGLPLLFLGDFRVNHACNISEIHRIIHNNSGTCSARSTSSAVGAGGLQSMFLSMSIVVQRDGATLEEVLLATRCFPWLTEEWKFPGDGVGLER
jgi:hypothetical protein